MVDEFVVDELELAEALGERDEGRLHLGARELVADAVVDSESEGEVVAPVRTVDVELVW